MFKWYEEAKSIAERDPAARGVWQVILQYPGYKALRMHRLAHWFHKRGLYFIARGISQYARHKTGIEIHPGAKIGKCLFIDHGMGVVIGETAEIGDYCTIYHGVTLGGTGKDKGKRHPTVGNNVLISAGAKILGPMKIGDNAKIGANAVVLREVEADTTVVGVPGRAVKRSGERIRQSFELDQIHIPDPVSQEFCKIRLEVEKLKSELARYDESFKAIENRLCSGSDSKDNKENTGETQSEE
ncbi:MAG: serine O-acetyltransferase [Clostridiaceae bacterium]|jgi:serine O-acetyltransferase|nr:serine O-acetyltransferase [Clostridiaceae bacterium]